VRAADAQARRVRIADAGSGEQVRFQPIGAAHEPFLVEHADRVPPTVKR